MSKLGITCNGMTWNSMGVSNKRYSGESVHLLPTISMISMITYLISMVGKNLHYFVNLVFSAQTRR